MKNAIKHALFQGWLFFILTFISTNLITPLLLGDDLKKPSLLFITLFTSSLGLLRGISAYVYKKKVIEDERLIAVRQRAQAIWFNITIVMLSFTPFCGMLYAEYIQNPSLDMWGYSIALDQISRVLMHTVVFWLFLILIGYGITEKILMKRHEK